MSETLLHTEHLTAREQGGQWGGCRASRAPPPFPSLRTGGRPPAHQPPEILGWEVLRRRRGQTPRCLPSLASCPGVLTPTPRAAATSEQLWSLRKRNTTRIHRLLMLCSKPPPRNGAPSNAGGRAVVHKPGCRPPGPGGSAWVPIPSLSG